MERPPDGRFHLRPEDLAPLRSLPVGHDGLGEGLLMGRDLVRRRLGGHGRDLRQHLLPQLHVLLDLVLELTQRFGVHLNGLRRD